MGLLRCGGLWVLFLMCSGAVVCCDVSGGGCLWVARCRFFLPVALRARYGWGLGSLGLYVGR